MNKKRKNFILNIITICIPSMICVVFFGVFFQLIVVNGDSMNPNFINGQVTLIKKFANSYARGDVVVFNKESFSEENLIKRIIAVEGDEIDIDFFTGDVSINGVVLQESYIAETTFTSFDVSFPQTVPVGCVFVMGDNRNFSVDSRDSSIGMVDVSCIIGKVVVPNHNQFNYKANDA